MADEYGLIDRNPVRVNPRNRKIKTTRPASVWLDRAEQIESLLAAARELDETARPDRRHVPRYALLSTLVFAGLRVGELVALRWRHVDLAAGRLYIADAKTAAGVRHVEILPALREALVSYKAGCEHTGPDEFVFQRLTRRGYRVEDIRNRTFASALRLANQRRVESGLPPLPTGLTPHKLRHTCCSLLHVCGYDLPRVMAMLGHADSTVTLRIYSHVMRSEPGERKALHELVGANTVAPDWAPLGTSTAVEAA